MVLTVYADTGALLYELPRPLFAFAGLATLVELLALAILRRLNWASVIGVVLTGLLFAPRATAGLVAGALAYRLLGRLRRGPENSMASSLAAFAAVFFIVGLVRVISSDAFEPGDLVRRTAPAAHADPAAQDIYLVLLDGYPRSDTLASWDYDNGWFEAELEERGFDVAAQSTTSYPYTILVTASMFNMQHIDEIARLNPHPESHVEQTRALSAVLNESSVIAELEGRGYWTIHAGLTEVRGAVRNVDQDIDTGEVRLWERQVLQRTSLWPWLCEDIVIPQHRSLVRSTFEAIGDVARADRAEPTFMFAHVMSPHTPIVFDANGEPADFRAKTCGSQFVIDASLIGVSEAVYGASMRDQVHYVNTSTLSAVDAIVDSSPEAIVVVFSDHGARYSSEVSEEWFASFFAARTPGQPDLFGEAARPIEIFPRLFGAYWDIDVPIPDGRRSTSVHGIILPLEMERYPRED